MIEMTQILLTMANEIAFLSSGILVQHGHTCSIIYLAKYLNLADLIESILQVKRSNTVVTIVKWVVDQNKL